MRIATLALLALVAAAPAHADNNSWATVGLGAQFGFVSPEVAGTADTPAHQYGLMTRFEVLRFLGFEAAVRLDNDPKTQGERHLSPRLQVAALLNIVPTRWFDLYAAVGLGAHEAGDLFDLDGETTSLQAGPGLEVFIGEHVAVGADFRFRVPGPTYLKGQVAETLSTKPIDDAMQFSTWQLDFGVSWYL